ncbi:contractile injection system protein, VgrG/Pvc8 family [Photorhabdus australis]|uniref:contractile injection system protein, VgrG/Pvc8 family n=1 Tax=Photorhabdus australis TaxID=286156 RepID=UPI0005662A4C|nr:contractile injection system protein, VgrG/Pvc8 family [Photorhabdus australis]
MDRNTLFSIFESYGRFQKDAEAKPFVQRRQQAVQNQRLAGYGQSHCFKLMPGKIFDLSEHPVEAINTRWQIVSIHHHGKCPQVLLAEKLDEPEGQLVEGIINWLKARLENGGDISNLTRADYLQMLDEQYLNE